MSYQSRILIVEDERLVAMAEREALRKLGFSAEVAASGELALEMATSDSYDAVLMDIHLGSGIDGVEAARRLTKSTRIPVVFISSAADPLTVEDARKVSPYPLLPKSADPFTIQQVLCSAVELHDRLTRIEKSADAARQLAAGCVDASVGGVNRSDGSYLREELYSLVRNDPRVFDFIEEGSLDGIWYWDVTEPSNEWMSPGFWKTFGYDPSEKRHLSAEWQDMIHPDDLQVALENFHRHLEDPDHPYDQVVRYKHKNGSTVWVRCRGLAIRDEYGKPVRMLGAHNELTSQMEAHQRQTALVREMNHRVKNNLAVLEAMIHIEQSESQKSREDSLSDISARLRAMMLVHEQLYQSGESADIEMRTYLEALVDRFVQASSDRADGLVIDLNAMPIHLKAGRASKAGMIVSEMLANTIKHAARPADGRRRVRIEFSHTEGNVFVTYQDYGQMPDNVKSLSDLSPGTGLTLIKAMVQDLKGELQLLQQEHTTFALRFPLPEQTQEQVGRPSAVGAS